MRSVAFRKRLPAHNIMRGIHAIIGICRIVVINGWNNAFTVCDIPIADPRIIPITADARNPLTTLPILIPKSAGSCPVCIISPPVKITEEIFGKIVFGTPVNVVAIYQNTSTAAGTASPNKIRFVFFIFPPPKSHTPLHISHHCLQRNNHKFSFYMQQTLLRCAFPPLPGQLL